MPRFWQRPPSQSSPDPTPEGERTVPHTISRILSYYTFKGYGRKLEQNLAPGVTLPKELKSSLPPEVCQLLEWHNGYIDAYTDNVILLPGDIRLLSLEEATQVYESKMATAVDENWWRKDIWPIMSAPDWQTLVVMERSTGRAAWRFEETDLADEGSIAWFKTLYDLLRMVEVAAEEERLCVRRAHGEPWSVEEKEGEGGIVEVDSDDEEEDEDEREEEKK